MLLLYQRFLLLTKKDFNFTNKLAIEKDLKTKKQRKALISLTNYFKLTNKNIILFIQEWQLYLH